VALAQAGGTHIVPIEIPRPNPAPLAPPGRDTLGISERSAAALSNAAALLSEFRWLIATPDGADSELSFDRGDVTDDRDVANIAIGELDSASSTSGIVDITWLPADITSGAAVKARLPAAGATPPFWRAGTDGFGSGGGELNGVTVDASAQARA